MAQRQVPGPGEYNNERIRSRPYESAFARLPREEVVSVRVPGAGPHESVDAVRWPAVLIVVGVFVVFAVFFIPTWVVLVLGLLLVLIGAVWAALTGQPGSGHGTGPVTIVENPAAHPRGLPAKNRT